VFTTIITRPIFNLLVLIYALLPGHNFGLSIIIFTIVIRLLLWPLVKKQLHQAKAMRKLQPELKRIKQATKGNRQKESAMLMELYKERGISPFGSIGILIIQLPILIGLYAGLRRIVQNPRNLVTFAYPSLQHLSWMKELAANIHRFDGTLFGSVDLTRAALNKGGGIYWAAMLIVIGSAFTQYLQAKQLMPSDKDSKSLRGILKAASSGEQADQSEVNAAVGRSTRFLLPAMIFIFTVDLASALSLYWFVGGLAAYAQQAYILRKDEDELEVATDKTSVKKSKKDLTAIAEAEVVANSKPTTVAKTKPYKKHQNKKRRKK
jgi:YidC/Oxa1 family membrane protein insertase